LLPTFPGLPGLRGRGHGLARDSKRLAALGRFTRLVGCGQAATLLRRGRGKRQEHGQEQDDELVKGVGWSAGHWTTQRRRLARGRGPALVGGPGG
jgi:hypothetical protein